MMRHLRLLLQRRKDRCPREWILTQHVSGELTDTRLEGHIRRCPRCASRCASLRGLVKQAQDLPGPAEMTVDAERAIAARLLATGPAPRSPRRWPVVVVGTPAAALLVAAVVWTTRGTWRAPTPPESTARPVMGAPDRTTTLGGPMVGHDRSLGAGSDPAASPRAAAVAPRSRAAVRAIGAARYTRVRVPPDDVLRLDDGAIVIEVAALPSGERFRVMTEDAEVEVRGTRFQVSASGGKLTGVSVASGRVEVRSAGGGRVVLDPGDEWVSRAGELNKRGAPSKEAESRGKPTRPPGMSRLPRARRPRARSIDPPPGGARLLRSGLVPPAAGRRLASGGAIRRGRTHVR